MPLGRVELGQQDVDRLGGTHEDDQPLGAGERRGGAGLGVGERGCTRRRGDRRWRRCRRATPPARARAAPGRAAPARGGSSSARRSVVTAGCGAPCASASRAAWRSTSTAHGSPRGALARRCAATRVAAAPSASSSRAARAWSTSSSGVAGVAGHARAHERVREAQGCAALEDVRGGKGRGRTRGRALVELGERGGVAQLRVVAEHRHRARERDRAGGEPRKAPPHGAIDSCRREPTQPGDGLRCGFEPFGRCGPDELGRQERVPARGCAHRGGEGGCYLGAHRGGDQIGDRRLAQRREVEHGPPVDQLGQQRVRRRGVCAPRSEHERERQIRETPREVDGAAHRGRVGPLRVVDRDQQAARGPRVRRRASTGHGGSPPRSGSRRPLARTRAQAAPAAPRPRAAPRRRARRAAPGRTAGEPRHREIPARARRRSRVSTVRRRRRAVAVSSSSTRVLPIPGLPCTTATPPRPASTESSRPASWASSASRSSRTATRQP